MGEPLTHVLPTGQLADWFDEAFEYNQKTFAHLILKEQDTYKDPNASLGTKVIHMQLESLLWGAVVIHGVTGGVAQSYTDILRFGDGLLQERSLAGVGKDALRLMNVIPLVGQAAKISQVKRLLTVSQVAGSSECAWVAMRNAANAAGRLGNVLGRLKEFLKTGSRLRVLVAVEELAQQSGVDLEVIRELGTSIRQWRKGALLRDLLQALDNMKIAFKELLPASRELTAMEEVLKANPRGASVVAIEGVTGAGKRFAHAVMAQIGRDGKILIYDSEPLVGAAKAARVFNGIEDLRKAYFLVARVTEIRLALNWPIIHIPNSMIINIVEDASMLANLFLPVVPGIKAAQPVR